MAEVAEYNHQQQSWIAGCYLPNMLDAAFFIRIIDR